MDYSIKETEKNGPDQEQENETQIDAASPSSSVELSEGAYPCPACPVVLSSSHELTNHLRGHNSPRSTDCSGEDDYSCRVCHKVLSSASSLDRHVLVHSGERPFKCKYCNMSFTTNGNMNRHLRTTHRTISPNSCTDSEGSSDSERPAATTQDEYNNNDIAKPDSPTFINCQQPSPNSMPSKRKVSSDVDNDSDIPRKRILLSNSRGEAKCRPKDVDIVYQCPVCGREDFATNAFLETHLQRMHPGCQVKCGTCDMSFKNFRVLNLHRSMTHFSESSEEGNNRSRSSVLGFSDLTFTDFTSGKFPAIARAVCEQSLHRPATGVVTGFQCGKCTHAFPCKAALEAHTKECGRTPKKDEAHQAKDISASDVPQQPDDGETKRETFFAVLDLKNKSSAHEVKDLADITSILNIAMTLPILQSFPRSDASTPENNVKFNSSTGSSGSSGTFSLENNEEEDACIAEFRKMKLKGEFPCRLCSSVFPNLRALKGHNRVHLGEIPGVPYPCNMCSYTSPDKSTLIRHMKAHNGDRPFECSLCNFAFTTKANCERHVRNRHGKSDRDDIKSVLIFHPSDDTINDNNARSSHRVQKERKPSLYTNEREGAFQRQMPVPIEIRGDIRMIEEGNPGPSTAHEMQNNRYDSQIFTASTTMQPLELVRRNAEETNLAAKSDRSRLDEDEAESRSSDGSIFLVTDVMSDSHQRTQASPMNLKKSPNAAPTMSNLGEEGPLDLSMDVLDLSKKSKEKNYDYNSAAAHEKCNSNFYTTTNQLLLTQALLSARGNSPVPTLENLYANAHMIYRNLGTLTANAVGAGIIAPYFMNPHVFSQELAAKGRLQRELVKGLQLTGGATLVDQSLPSSSYNAYQHTRDVVPQNSSEQNDHAHLINPQIINKTAPARERDNIPSNNSVKMVIKNGVLMPKQKQRRYRTERPFGCEHCEARFTLRSNMERHIKQQHPKHWRQRPRGGHSTRGRPPASHPTLLQNLGPSTSQLVQPYPNILPKSETLVTSEYNTHPISDQVKYAILAQHLKSNKIDENDSEEELVIDEDDKEQEVHIKSEPNTSLLRDQLENVEGIKDTVTKTEIKEVEKKTSNESESEQITPDNASEINAVESAAVPESKLMPGEETVATETVVKDQIKLEDGTADLASVSKLLDNASQQYQQFQPQYLSDEEGLVASTSDCNNSGSDNKSDSLNSLNSQNSENITTNKKKKKKKKKKKSAYSMAPNRVICPFCQRQFPWTSSLRRHILTHTGQKPYQCVHCQLYFTTKSNCDRHLLRKHKTNPNKMRKVRNSSSPDIQVVVNNANSIFSMRNVPERPYKCNQCPSSTFSTLGNLKKHRSAKHPRKNKSRSDTPSSDQQNSPPQCSKQNDQSDYESQSSSISENMINSPSTIETVKTNSNTSPPSETNRSRRSPRSSPGPGDVPFKCHLCDGGFSERQDCLEHIKTNHKRSYEMLMAKGALDMDIDATEDQMLTMPQHPSDGEEKKGRFPDYSNRKVVCAFCMRRFWSAEDLRRHMRTHTGERPFQCDICSRRFTLKHSMLRHRKKHESVDSVMYIATSGDEENSPTQPPTITPRSQQHPPVSANTSRPQNQDRVSLPIAAAVATADAAPSSLMRYNHYDNIATLSGRMANDGSQSVGSASPPSSIPPIQPAEAPSESGDNDLISNLLGIREKGLLDKVLLSTADDAAKLLGVNHSE